MIGVKRQEQKNMKRLIERLLKPYQEQKLAKLEAEIALNRIMGEAAAKDPKVASQIALIKAQNMNHTLKDEFALITIAAPFWLAIVLTPLGMTGYINDMFVTMQSIPSFWQETFQWAILAALGVTTLNKAIRK